MYQCWWRTCQKNVFFSVEYKQFYVLYLFVTYLLTLPSILFKRTEQTKDDLILEGRGDAVITRREKWGGKWISHITQERK
jgi:hypothetical protein